MVTPPGPLGGVFVLARADSNLGRRRMRGQYALDSHPPGRVGTVPMGLEGIVSKRVGSPYVTGGMRGWLKPKNLSSGDERCPPLPRYLTVSRSNWHARSARS